MTALHSRTFTDYEDEDYEEGEEGGEETEAEGEPSEAKVEVTSTPHPEDIRAPAESHPSKVPENEGDDEEEGEEDAEENEIPDEGQTILHSVKEDPTTSTTTTTAAPQIIDLCQSGNGGCDHNCRFVADDPQGFVECSCFAGFTLDPANGRTCHGESLLYFSFRLCF